MDHMEALHSMAAEKYLLNELAPAERDAFEEHYFSCHECAEDITAGAALLEQGKRLVLREREEAALRSPIALPVRPEAARPVPPRSEQPAPPRSEQPVPPRSEQKDWFAWLRPAFAVPAFALLLLVVGFQNIVQLPGLERSLREANAPQVLPSAYLASGGSRGEEQHILTAKAGGQSVVVLDIPGPANAAYTAELYDSAGQKQWAFAIPESATKEGLSLRLPGSLAAGEYSLSVKSVGDAREVARYGFTLRR